MDNTDKKYEVTDELRKKYSDIYIKLDTANLLELGYHQLFIDKLVELLPVMNAAVKDMSILEAEYMVDKTGIGSMFDGVYGMEEERQYIRHEAFKVAVEHNKDKVLRQFTDAWNKMATAATPTAPDESPGI